MKITVFTKEEKKEIKDECQRLNINLDKIEAKMAVKKSFWNRNLYILLIKVKNPKMPSKEVGEIFHLHSTTVNDIVSRYKKEGISSVSGAVYKGNVRRLSFEDEKEMIIQASDSQGVVQFNDLNKLLQENGLTYKSKSSVYKMLARHGYEDNRKHKN